MHNLNEVTFQLGSECNTPVREELWELGVIMIFVEFVNKTKQTKTTEKVRVTIYHNVLLSKVNRMPSMKSI
jgi:hypothetical protein